MCYNNDGNKTDTVVFSLHSIFDSREGLPLTSERYYDYYGDTAVYRSGAPGRPRPAMQRAQAARPRGYGTVHRTSAPRNAPRTQQGRNRTRPDVRRAPGPAKRPPARRASRGLPMAAKLGMAIALLVALVVAGFFLLRRDAASGAEQYVNNVYVNGVCLTGYTREEGRQLMYDRRDQWLNAVTPLTWQGRTWSFSPAMVNAQLELDDSLERAWSLGHIGDAASRREIVNQLKLAPAEFNTEPTYDSAALDEFVAKIAEEVYVEPTDAEVTLTSVKPQITRASENGWALDEDALKAQLTGIIMTGQGDTQLPVHEVLPTVASDNMEMDVIAKCETDVTFRGYPSRTNVRLALEHFNLLAVYPGDTVSFNDVVGPRTEALGYKEAPEYAGTTKEMGIGGGVCQASTTLYNAAIQAGMTIIERHRHTMTVTYVDPSLDAAVNYHKKDLVFRNDTEHAIYIYTNVTKKLATVTIYGTRPEYHYVLESTVLRESESNKVGYQDDEEGEYVYYTTDEPVLYRKGRGSCESEGWIVSYDWETGREVDRVQISHDVYSAGLNVYWRGVHDADGKVETTAVPLEY